MNILPHLFFLYYDIFYQSTMFKQIKLSPWKNAEMRKIKNIQSVIAKMFINTVSSRFFHVQSWRVYPYLSIYLISVRNL